MLLSMIATSWSSIAVQALGVSAYSRHRGGRKPRIVACFDTAPGGLVATLAVEHAVGEDFVH